MKRFLPALAMLAIIISIGYFEWKKRSRSPTGSEPKQISEAASSPSASSAVEQVAGTAKNPLTASTPTITLACNRREQPKMSCYDEAIYHEYRVEIMRAKDLYFELCDQGNGDACYRIGLLHRDNGAAAKMGEYYQKACALKHGTACFNIANIEKSMEETKTLMLTPAEKFEKLNAKGRENVANLFREMGQISTAIPHFIVACQGGISDACFALGEIARASESPVEARLRFVKACDMGNKDACEAKRALR